MKDYVYEVKGRNLFLYEVLENGTISDPSESITNGLKFEYTTTGDLFVTSAGTAVEYGSVVESTEINFDYQYSLAFIDYIKAQLRKNIGDFAGYRAFMAEFYSQIEKTYRKRGNSSPAATKTTPYMILRRR